MEKRVRDLFRIAGKIVDRKVFVKLKKIKDQNELERALKYSIVSSFKHEYQKMEMQIKALENETKHVFFAKNKLILVPSKIKHLEVEFDKEDFEKLFSLFSSVRKEIENV